jgi:enoyl-CoA hydratase
MSVLVEHSGPVTTWILNRPEHRNAVDHATARALREAVAAFEADESAAVAVLTGAGGHFCAGFDLKAVAEAAPDYDPLGDGPMGPTRRLPAKPVLAAVEGYAVAGGLELALWCDLRIASASATFGIFCRRWGVPLIDGGTYRLPQIVGLGRALDWILTGREVPAAEAERAGFVTRLVPDGTALAAAVELAAGIAEAPWTCVTHDRTSVYEGLGLGLEEGLANEDRHGQAVIFADGFLDGVAEFTANQKARSDAGER